MPPIDWRAVNSVIERRKAEEVRRESIQGKGRGIVSTDFKGYKLVAVGNVLYWSKSEKTRTFTDFLGNYIRTVFTPEWGNAELAKPLADRHPLLKWYDKLCALQRAHFKSGEVSSLPNTGLPSAWYSLAYNLYLLQHNAEVQSHLITRLKDERSFLPAVYETHVASWFILAGFKLTLENEQDSTSSHCEFTAESPSGQRYSVEAKRREPLKPHLDIGNQLAKALRKQAAYQRVVCIDLNVRDTAIGAEDAFLQEMNERVRRMERTLHICYAPAPSAYLLVTNIPHHLHLDDKEPKRVLLADGYKISDFGTKEFPSLTEAYKAHQKHADIENVTKAFQGYKIPTTFDGELPEFAFGHAERRFIIGDRHQMDDGFIGVLERGIVVESEKFAYLVYNADGRRVIYKAPLSDAELSAFKGHPETFFGKVENVEKQLTSTLDLYTFIYESYKDTPRQRILDWLGGSPDFAKLAALPDDELRYAYAERTVIGMIHKNPPKDVRFREEGSG